MPITAFTTSGLMLALVVISVGKNTDLFTEYTHHSALLCIHCRLSCLWVKTICAAAKMNKYARIVYYFRSEGPKPLSIFYIN